MEDNERIVREFIEAWSRLDPEELAGYFADDGVYHNMPIGPISGRDNVEEFIRGFVGSWTETTWEILNIVCSGGVVIAERLDRTRAGEKSVDLPCTGVFELEAGKIKIWRDYFDLGTFTKGMS
jgi:limonene-1,2-epoxide hydrolase